MFALSSKISPSSEPTEILHVVFLLRFFRSFIKSVCPYQNAGENEITLSFQLDIPYLEFDRAMLQRTLSNLISNAVRYTEPGSTIAIKSWETLSSIHLAVENPGSEIPAEYLPKLFDRFYRIDPSRQKGTEGAGLGLSIVRAIVVAHGGSINATSENGLTSFVMTFPKPYIEKRG